MKNIWSTTFFCLTPKERKQSAGVLILMVLMAIFEVVGIASVIPFLAVMGDPSMIERQPALAWGYEKGTFTNPESYLTALGVIAFVLLVVATVIRSATLYVQNQFLQMIRHTLGYRLLSGYLSQPYEFFLNRHTGELGKNILSEVDMFVDRALLPIGNVISVSLLLLAIITLLILVNPLTALIVSTVLGSFYLLVYRLVRSVMGRGGEARAEANRVRFETAAEAMTGIKALKVLGREASYMNRFFASSETVARNLALASILGQIPKYAVETLAFGGIILGALFVLRSQGIDGSLGTLLPMLSLYAFSGYRMLPSVQGIYANLTTLRFGKPAVETIARELASLQRGQFIPAMGEERLPLNRTLELRNISYSYPNSTAGLKSVSLTLHKGESLGIIGRTGSGKTTLVDVILGLLVPQKGEVLVDGLQLDAVRRRSWQKSIGYVPQDIFLTDASVAENIALGLPRDQIDQELIERAVQIARIHDFIVTSLPEGYATHVGERGLRLSGGQRQRIGIARALYNDPEVIVFDEATSALDVLTENEVMEAMSILSKTKTVILIAHRTGTLATCNKVVRLEGGSLFNVNA